MSIHPTAILDAGAILADGVTIGPNALIGPGVVLDEGVEIGANAVVARNTRIGAGTIVHPLQCSAARPRAWATRVRRPGS